MSKPPCPPVSPTPGVILLLLVALAIGQAGVASAAFGQPTGRGPAAGFAACRTAIAAASQAAGLPGGLLAAVAAVESGRPDPNGRVRGPVLRAAARSLLGAAADTPPPSWQPWPWTINADGVGQFFATRAQAIAAVAALQAAGVSSIDVGCLQVNLRDHPHAFRTLAEAFDPAANARYAAGFLNRLFARLHAWPAAVAAYHSQTPALGRPYRKRVFARWHGAAPAAVPHAYADFLPRANKYADFAAP
ncbi:MAG: lytic transglycosylase domain-containing protein [Proteobacteria bacterium]|nr:lytic transglycosylase domain-containing protein [Pseudomonadota bacterium]